jgi:propanediol dehydratase small subunit
MPEYPLAEMMPERLRTPTGRAFQDLTLDALLEGSVNLADLRVTAEALDLQAQVAEDAARPQLAANLRRAGELVAVPEELILEVYRALRPGRSTAERMEELAAELESRYGAKRCAALVREAAACASAG